MAREWHAVFSGPAASEPATWYADDHAQGVSRSWSADRGTVLWEGSVDLAGSFPGYAPWGSSAEAVHLTITDTYLLIEEGSEFGFGLPIGWLSAAQSATGQEPVSLDAGHRLRISYRDQQAVRQFALRVRGGRFGSKTARLAEQLRLVFARMGLAGLTTAGNGLPGSLPLGIGWDEFAEHEHEPVVWSGRTTMPTGSGDTATASDVWLTDQSLIWSTQGRGDIHRIALDALVGVMPAEVPGVEPVPALYWIVTGPGPRQTDLLMPLSSSGGQPDRHLERNVLLTALAQHDVPAIAPSLPPQPWWQPVEAGRSALISTLPAPSADAAPVSEDERDQVTAPAPAAAIAPIRQADRDWAAHLPASTPLPWGERVERAEPAESAPVAAQPGPATPAPSPSPAAPRIWPPVSGVATATQPASDPAVMLVRRPPRRAPITDEFPAAVSRVVITNPARKHAGQEPDAGASSEHSTSQPFEIEIAFRQTPPLASLATFGHRGAQWTVDNTYPMTVTAPNEGEPTPPADSAATGPVAPETRMVSRVSPDQASRSAADVQPNDAAPTAAGSLPAPANATMSPTPVRGRPVLAAAPAHAVASHRTDSVRDQLLAAIAGIDQTLADTLTTLRSVERDPAATTVTRSANGCVTSALAALDTAVASGALSRPAAETHRVALTRTADTNERLRSLIDLRRRGYLTAAELAGRRDALLGRSGTV